MIQAVSIIKTACVHPCIDVAVHWHTGNTQVLHLGRIKIQLLTLTSLLCHQPQFAIETLQLNSPHSAVYSRCHTQSTLISLITSEQMTEEQEELA